MENEIGSVTWSILDVTSYDAIFSNILVLFVRVRHQNHHNVDIGATINWASSIDRSLSKELEGQLEIPKHQINKQSL